MKKKEKKKIENAFNSYEHCDVVSFLIVHLFLINYFITIEWLTLRFLITIAIAEDCVGLERW